MCNISVQEYVERILIVQIKDATFLEATRLFLVPGI